jgi:hypothetical protein
MSTSKRKAENARLQDRGRSADRGRQHRPAPAKPPEMPSISPSAAAGAPRVAVTNEAISEAGISWPTSARKLAVPIPATPGASQGRWPARRFASVRPVTVTTVTYVHRN